ncbi:MAG: hypothetical protein H0S85_17590 [Desulfovibrionaceae bacterium]|jgi:hypothetical protein|nr:hypothetical protein [Desulfovibrionaceae bacterium]
MTSDDLTSYRELAGLLGVTETTIKSYRSKFPPFLKPVNQGKPLRFPAVAREVCARIRQCFGDGRSIAETRAVLIAEFPFLLPDSASVGAASDAPGAAFAPAAPGASSASDTAALQACIGPLATALDGMARGFERFARTQEAIAENLNGLRAQLAGRGPVADADDDAEGAAGDAAAAPDLGPEILATLEGLRRAVAELAAHVEAPAGRAAERGPGAPLEASGAPLGDAQESAAPRIDIAPPTQRRVRVTNAFGQTTEYLLRTDEVPAAVPSEDEPASTAASASAADATAADGTDGQSGTDGTGEPPPAEYRALPLVVREGDEYLGVGGRSLGTLSLDDVAALAVGDAVVGRGENGAIALGSDGGSGRPDAALLWRGGGQAWSLDFPLRDGRVCSLRTRRTTTPRGNRVALLETLRIDDLPQSPAEVIPLIRRLAGE